MVRSECDDCALSSGRINPVKRSCNYRTKLFLELRFGNKGKEKYQAAGWEDGASTDGLSWPGTDSRRCYVSFDDDLLGGSIEV